MNTAKIHKNGIYKTTKSNYSALLHPSSFMFKEQSRWVLYNEIVLTTKEFMRNVVEIEDKWLLEIAPHYIRAEDIEEPKETKKSKKKKTMDKIESIVQKFERRRNVK